MTWNEIRDRYLKMAADLTREADRMDDPKIAEAYLEMARVWLKLADQQLTAVAANTDETNDEGRREA